MLRDTMIVARTAQEHSEPVPERSQSPGRGGPEVAAGAWKGCSILVDAGTWDAFTPQESIDNWAGTS